MAQITILKDKEGKTIYPITSSEAIFDKDGISLEARLNKLPAPDKIVTNEGDQTINGVLTAKGVKVSNGTKAQFLKGDGSVDDTKYLTEEVYNKERTQMNSTGFYGKDNNRFYDSVSYKNSGAIPLNRDQAIEYRGQTTGNAASITFLDVNKGIIHSVQFPDPGTHVITPDKFPENAAFFVAAIHSVYLQSFHYKNGETKESRENALAQLTQEAKKLLFIDMWKSLSIFNLAYKYYPETDTFGAEVASNLQDDVNIEARKYILTDMTFAEAIEAYNYRMPSIALHNCYKGRMSVVPWGYQQGSGPSLYVPNGQALVYNQTIEVCVLAVPNAPIRVEETMRVNNCRNLKAIIGAIYALGANKNPLSFYYLTTDNPQLEYMTPTIRADFDIRWFSKLTLFTMKYIVEHAENTSAITITVHPDVYAKLTNTDASEYVPANLLVRSNSLKNGTHAMGYVYMGGLTPKTGDEVTVTIWGELGAGKTHFNIYNSSGNGDSLVGSTTQIAEGVYSVNLKWKEYANNNFLNIAAMPIGITTESRIEKVKLEFGNNANPEWTPAIEEIEDDELREKAQWANLLYQAAAKNIQFATVE